MNNILLMFMVFFAISTRALAIDSVPVTGLADSNFEKIVAKNINLATPAGTYDFLSAGGNILVMRVAIYVQSTATTFTSLSIQTNQTTPFTVMSAAEGAVANLTAQRNVPIANHSTPFYLSAGQKIQFSIIGATGTGTITAVVYYRGNLPGDGLN